MSDQPGVSVSQVARKHGIVTGMLFRWRVQFGVAQKRVKLAPAALMLRDLVQPPNGMMAIDLPDGRRVFAPACSDPAWFVSISKAKEQEDDDRSRVREGASGLGYTDMRKGLDGLAMLVQ